MDRKMRNSQKVHVFVNFGELRNRLKKWKERGKLHENWYYWRNADGDR